MERHLHSVPAKLEGFQDPKLEVHSDRRFNELLESGFKRDEIPEFIDHERAIQQILDKLPRVTHEGEAEIVKWRLFTGGHDAA